MFDEPANILKHNYRNKESFNLVRNKKNPRKSVVLPRRDIYEFFTTLQLCPGKVYSNLLKDLPC